MDVETIIKVAEFLVLVQIMLVMEQLFLDSEGNRLLRRGGATDNTGISIFSFAVNDTGTVFKFSGFRESIGNSYFINY